MYIDAFVYVSVTSCCVMHASCKTFAFHCNKAQESWGCFTDSYFTLYTYICRISLICYICNLPWIWICGFFGFLSIVILIYLMPYHFCPPDITQSKVAKSSILAVKKSHLQELLHGLVLCYKFLGITSFTIWCCMFTFFYQQFYIQLLISCILVFRFLFYSAVFY